MKQKEETKAKAAWPSVLSWKFNLCIDTTQPQPGEYAHSGLAWLCHLPRCAPVQSSAILSTTGNGCDEKKTCSGL